MKSAQIIAWLLFAAILFITVDPINLRPESGLPVNVERFLAFAVLGFVFAFAYPKRWLLILLLVVCAAFGFELAQMLAPTRHARLLDAIFKAAGGVSGVIVSNVFLRMFR
ncbi:VanZ family protein [Phyllobacterium sp. TAF24]|uniref:VanZ family protein n=1 Tax=Phyllobacterium sp. TAF24 TaxID=3233068 RepID=UPI003F954DBC